GGARIGTSLDAPAAAGGNIDITSGGDIQLVGSFQTGIRTAGSTLLTAGGSINGDSFIESGSLTTSSGGSTLLGGPNRVASFNGSTTGGDLMLSNLGSLDVTGVNVAG